MQHLLHKFNIWYVYASVVFFSSIFSSYFTSLLFSCLYYIIIIMSLFGLDLRVDSLQVRHLCSFFFAVMRNLTCWFCYSTNQLFAYIFKTIRCSSNIPTCVFLLLLLLNLKSFFLCVFSQQH